MSDGPPILKGADRSAEPADAVSNVSLAEPALA